MANTTVTIQYEKARGMNVVVLEKTFKTEQNMQRWVQKQGEAVKVLRYAFGDRQN